MIRKPHQTARRRYTTGVEAAAEARLGERIGVGTTIVADPDRAGSNAAVIYPLAGHTLVWCSPEFAPGLGWLADDVAFTGEEVVEKLLGRGGELLGAGNHRVLDIGPIDRSGTGCRLVRLDPAEPAALRRLQAFIDDCDPDDLDEAELALDDLDDTIIVAFDDDDTIAAFSSVRPWSIDPDFDDIAVLTHPKHRRKGLAAAVVSALSSQQQAAGRLLFYSCDVDNIGSNRVAESVGFDLVATVSAVSIG
jgi:GNAT superfamily N-acetyltransferase